MRAARIRLAVAALLAPTALLATPTAAAPVVWAGTGVPLGPIQQNTHVSPLGAGRDNGQSAGLGKASYWVFGDTLESTGAGVQFVDNTGAMTRDLDGSDGITLTSSNLWTEDPDGVPQPIVHPRREETAFAAKHSAASGCTAETDPYCGTGFAFWPGAIVPDPARKRLLVLYGKLCRGGATKCTSGFAGTGIGTGIAAIDPARRTVTRLRAINTYVDTPEGEDPTLLFGTEGGSGSAFAHGGYLYALLDCANVTFICKVGRVPLAKVMDRIAWQFYAGSARGKPQWSYSLSAGKLVTRMGAAGGTIQWVPAMKAFLNTYLQPLGNDAVFQTAATPWGPWTELRTMYTSPQAGPGPNYAGFAHPEYAEDGGLTQYFSYYQTGAGVIQLVKVRFCPATGPVTVCTG